MRLRYALLVLIFGASTLAWGQTRPGSLRGTVKDKKTGEELVQAIITVKSGQFKIASGASDFDGNYNINPVQPGTYTVVCEMFGYTSMTFTGVEVNPGRPTELKFALSTSSVELGAVDVVAKYEAPLIEKGKTAASFSADQIRNLAGRGVNAVLSQTASVVQDERSGGTFFRGGRGDANVVFVDGVKMRGDINLPREAIQTTEVITGGVPAQYGDVTGGVISTTTKGPSPRYFGTVEYVTSALFDRNNYHLGGLTLGGPLLFNKDKSAPIVGFLLATEFNYTGVGRPYATPVYKIKDDVLADLRANPLMPTATGLGTIRRAELLTKDAFEVIPTRLNVGSTVFRATGNINIKTSKKTNLVIGGRAFYSNGRNGSFFHSLLNYYNNGASTQRDLSGYVRFTQQFGNGDDKGLIRNAFYTIQADYTINNFKNFDPNHGDNIFRYGHVGKFQTGRVGLYGYGQDDKTGITAWRKLLDLDTGIAFTPSSYNPVLGAYTQSYYNLVNSGLIANNVANLVNIQQGGGLLNGQTPYDAYGLFGNVGAVQSGYNYSQNEQYRITASTNFDIKGHSLIAGLEYEQRFDRSFGVASSALWTLMRNLQNDHMRELDLENPILVYRDGVFQDTIFYNRALDLTKPRAFDRNLRSKLGWDPDGKDQRLLDIDNISPDDFANYGGLSLFSAQELVNPGGTSYVSYFGYDYMGNLQPGNPTLADFFRATDANGNRTYPVRAFQPIYMAGYIQDQFTFEDLFFNVGVRVDRYDANQPVLRDPFSLFPAHTVADVKARGGLEGSDIPTSIGDGYMVYVDDIKNPKRIIGYRNGFDWYNADGSPQPNPTVIANASGGQAKPWIFEEAFSDPRNPNAPILSERSFRDYRPQVTVSPRISFQFPISDVAEFFAHYDLLVQRPTAAQSRFNPFDYQNLVFGNASVVDNPELLPQKQTEYEIGFRQKLTDRSALKINAFYREYRDLIQTVSVTEAYPATYVTYGNRDFTTSKGFSFQYDLRRIGNVQMNAQYSLTFADGTGSGAESGLSLARTGLPNIRYIVPLDYDQRHNLSGNIDFRYGQGVDYNGPVWGKVKVFENAGVNMLATAGSGFPYSRRVRAYSITESATPVVGLLNGSRLPWQFRVDMTANKVWYYNKGRNNFEVYLQVLNVLNAANVLGIYPFTGSADDDGYLSSPQGQQAIAFTANAQAFSDLYTMRMVNPTNFSTPRLLRLGVRLGL